MSDLKIAEQLKALKHERAGGSPDAQWLLSTRETLLMQIRNTVGEEASGQVSSVKGLFTALRFFMPENMGRLALVPVMLLLLAVGANFGSSAVIIAAQGTLPGDTLYGMKLAAERMSLKFASGSSKAERRLEIAGRRLDEMTSLSASVEPKKDEKLARVAALFSQAMTELRADLTALQTSSDAEAAVQIALRVDVRADEYMKTFERNGLYERPSMRLAILSLDQVSLRALEVLVERSSANSGNLPEAQLTSAAHRTIESFASHVATADGPSVMKAKEAVEEARALLAGGDFKAAVRKVAEGADLVSQAAPETNSATTTDETSATSTDEAHE